jgi:hypothetical protein
MAQARWSPSVAVRLPQVAYWLAMARAPWSPPIAVRLLRFSLFSVRMARMVRTRAPRTQQAS